MDLKLLNKFARNRCNSDEVENFFEWIQKNEDTSHLHLLKQYWDDIKVMEFADNELSDKQLDKIHHQINIIHSENIGQSQKIRISSTKKRLLQVFTRAAVILLASVITLLIYTQFFQKTFVVNNEIVSPPGSRTFLELSDGTKVWLNQGSKMVYPQQFSDKKRIVSLIGEGYFEVAHNPEKPFIVEAGGLQIKALGTTFNIKAYTDDNHFEATLESGKIQVQQIGSGNSSPVCTMTPGQHFTLDHKTNKFSIEYVEPFKYLAWKDGKLVFDDDHLDKVAEQLSRWYNVNITIKDPKLADYTYKATFFDESLSQILEMMEVVMPITCVEVKREKNIDGVFSKQEVLIFHKEKSH